MSSSSRSAWSSALRPIAVAAVVLILSGCTHQGLLYPVGPVARAERTMFWNAVVIMSVVVLPPIFMALYFSWRYQAKSPKGKYRPDWSFSGKLELLVWSVPTLIIIFLGGIPWIGSHDVDPGRPIASKQPPLQVQVVALDWKWLFIYPEQGVASVNYLVMPLNRPVRFHITSATVMNSFQVPSMGSQIYAMAGMDAPLHYMAERPGRYYGLSAHYSGNGFPEMMFFTDAVTPAAFDAWVAKTRGGNQVLDWNAYKRLAYTQSTTKPYTYRAVAPGLYPAALRQSAIAPLQRPLRFPGKDQ